MGITFDEILSKAHKTTIKMLEDQEGCISRSEALSVFRPKGITEDVWKECDVYKKLTALPPVTPQPKVGEWLEKEVIDNSYKVIEEWQSARCSVCDRYHTTPYMYYFSHYKYCPNCGCRMTYVPDNNDGKMKEGDKH